MIRKLERGLFVVLLSILGLLGLSGNAMAQGESFLLGMGIAIVATCMIIVLIVAILVGIWIYRDANRRGMSGGLWLLIFIVASLFLNLIGFIVVLIIYLVVRKDRQVPPMGAYPPPPPPPQ